MVFILPRRILGHDRCLVNRGNALARRMAASFSQPTAGTYMGSGVFPDSGADISLSWRHLLLQHSPNAQTPAVQNSDHWPGRIWSCFGANRPADVSSTSTRPDRRHLL